MREMGKYGRVRCGNICQRREQKRYALSVRIGIDLH